MLDIIETSVSSLLSCLSPSLCLFVSFSFGLSASLSVSLFLSVCLYPFLSMSVCVCGRVCVCLSFYFLLLSHLSFSITLVPSLNIHIHHICNFSISDLIVCVDEVAASGGYMMTSVANTIVASPFAMLVKYLPLLFDVY